MKSIQPFFKTIQDSIYSPKFYAEISKQPLSKGFKYFFLLILFLTLVHVISLVPILLNEAPRQAKQLENQVVAGFPQELKVNITKGQVTTNVQEPYFIALPKSNNSKPSQLNNLIVIDTKTPFSINQFGQYKTFAWLTKDSIAYNAPDSPNELRMVDFSKVDKMNIDKGYVKWLASQFDPWLNYLGLGLVIVTTLSFYLLYIVRLVQLLVLALIIVFMLKLMKQKISYRQAYQIGTYAITLGLIIELLVDLLSSFVGSLSNLPFMVAILTLAVVYVNFAAKKSKT